MLRLPVGRSRPERGSPSRPANSSTREWMTLMPIAFATIDWWIVGLYMLVSTIPGFLCRKYIKGQDDFLLAGRTLSVWLAVATLTATEMGLVTVMYMAQMGFVNGLSAMVVGLIAGGTTLVVGLTGFMVSGLRASGVTTVAEYYEKRYAKGVRLLGGLIIAAAGILNYGVFLRVEADFVRLITQIPDITVTAQVEGAVPFTLSSIKLVMTVLVLLVLTYTLLGGMVSVVLTDYIQFIILSVGMGITTWWVLQPAQTGGFQGIYDAVVQHRPGYGLNPLERVESPSGVMLGVGLLWIIWQTMHWTGTNTWQTQAFRTAAADSPRTAKAMWALTGVNYFGRAVVPMLWGVAALAFFTRHPGSGDVATMDSLQAMPMFLTHLPAGLVGLLLAGMLAALMSTHSSYLLAWSGVLTEDLVTPVLRMMGIELRVGTRIWITRFFILCMGAFLLGYGLWFKAPSTIWNYLSITGTMYISGAAVLVAMGLYWKRANARGAYLALLCGALPGLAYLVLNITSLIVEPAIREAGHVRVTAVARAALLLTEERVGLASFPLAVIGMIVGSAWGARGASTPAETAGREVQA